MHLSAVYLMKVTAMKHSLLLIIALFLVHVADAQKKFEGDQHKKLPGGLSARGPTWTVFSLIQRK